MTRVLLFTGKGGVGKTTLSAASAVACADRGLRTLVMSTDPAHSLADVLDAHVTPGVPVLLDDNLWLEHIDARMLLERSWGAVQDYLLNVLSSAGVDTVSAEELTVLPGAEEVLSLLEVRDKVRSDEYDVVILDCAPTAETLRLLALPEALEWYMRRIWPLERRVVTALRVPLAKATRVPMPDTGVLDAVERLHQDLHQVREVLTSEDASVRLVMTPDSVVLAEARRTLTSLSLYGYRVDGALANRMFPPGRDQWRSGWVSAQKERLEQARADLDPVPLHGRPLPGPGAGRRGAASVARGSGLPRRGPAGAACRRTAAATGAVGGADSCWCCNLPLAVKGDVDLAERGNELIVTVGPYRRVLALPGALQRYGIAGAGLADGVLRVRFLPRDKGRQR